jgi:acyl-CoA reductase-like NAD-dependent aldehyde dehydrogenase
MQANLSGHVPAISARAQSWLAGSAKKMLIDGKWVSAVSGETFDTVDPGNGSVLARVSRGVSSDIDAAVNAARRAFDQGPWRRMPPAERAKILWRVADLMDAHIDELAELETLDQGKPLFMGRWAEIPLAAMAIFTNSGQICTAGSRVYAHESIFDAVVQGISQIARSLKLGHGLLPDTAIGPLP